MPGEIPVLDISPFRAEALFQILGCPILPAQFVINHSTRAYHLHLPPSWIRPSTTTLVRPISQIGTVIIKPCYLGSCHHVTDFLLTILDLTGCVSCYNIVFLVGNLLALQIRLMTTMKCNLQPNDHLKKERLRLGSVP